MNRIHTITITVVMAAASAVCVAAGPRVTLELGDGSRLRGSVASATIGLATPDGRMDVPVGRIHTLAFVTKSAKGETWREAAVTLRNGDRLNGRITTRNLDVKTPYGQASVPIRQIERIEWLPINATAGLVSFWSADGDARDIAGGHHGRVGEGVCYTADRFGRPGWAFRFDGKAAAARITVPDCDALDTDCAFTLSAWVKPTAYKDSSGDRGWIVSKWLTGNPGGHGDYALAIQTDGRLQLIVAEKVAKEYHYFRSNEIVPLNIWTHVAATFDRGRIKLYIDGKAVAEMTSKLVKRTDPAEYPNDDVIIGAHCGGMYRFTGAIDEVGLWCRALSDAELATLAADRPSVKGPVAFWTADGNAKDSGGVHHGAPSPGVAYGPDRHGKPRRAFVFNGTRGLVKVRDAAALDTDDTFTLSAWTYPKAYRDERRLASFILTKWDSGGRNADFILCLSPAGKLRFQVGRKEGRWAQDLMEAKSVAPLNAWTHVAATFDRGCMRIYVNGRLEATRTSSVKYTQRTEYPHDDVYIGGLWDDNYNFDGRIDDVGIWNRALSDAEVAKLADTSSGDAKPGEDPPLPPRAPQRRGGVGA